MVRNLRRFGAEDLQRTKTDAIDALSIARFAAQKRPVATRVSDTATDRADPVRTSGPTPAVDPATTAGSSAVSEAAAAPAGPLGAGATVPGPTTPAAPAVPAKP